MINFNDFKNYNNFDNFLSNGETLTKDTLVPSQYYKNIKLFFEEPDIITKYNKTQIMNILFNDGDIVTYIVKYNKIFKNKIYKISNIPYSKNNNINHIIEVLKIIFDKIPSAVILMYEDELLYNDILILKKNLLSGYENYYYCYDDLLAKIKAHKSSRNKLNRYLKNSNLEYHINLTPELRKRMKIIFDKWFNTHPSPRKNTEKIIQELLKNNPVIFILTYNKEDIGCVIGAKTNDYYVGAIGFDLCRLGYQNATLFLDFFICKFLKEKFNINKYFICGYADGNTSLRNYKEKWASNKIKIYGLNKEYLNKIKDILLYKEETEDIY